MKTITFERIVLAILLVALLFQPRSSMPTIDRGVQLAGLAQSREPIVLSPGETLNVQCETGFRLEGGSNLYNLNLRCNEAAQPSRTPAPSATSTATSTIAVPTATEHAHNPTATPPSGGYHAWQLCHAPGVGHEGQENPHSHEDCPPLWADWFSEARFGHRVIYGGDETTGEMEWMHKHFAFTGTLALMNYSSATTADDVLLFARRHRGSTPIERVAVYHSYEYYALDRGGINLWEQYLATGDAALIPQIVEHVSFWQGWDWCGTARLTHWQADALAAQDLLPPFRIFTPDQRDWDNKRRTDSWYCTGGRWSWDNSWVTESATTFFHPEEEAAMTMEELMDISNWDLTGATELVSQRSEFVHCAPNNPRCLGSNTMVGGFCAIKVPIPNVDPNKQPSWTLRLNVSDPLGCPDGYLWQYVAPSFPKVGVSDVTGNTYKDVDLPGDDLVEVPN